MKTITISQLFRQVLFRRPSEMVYEPVELEEITQPPVEERQPPPCLKYDDSPPGYKVRWH